MSKLILDLLKQLWPILTIIPAENKKDLILKLYIINRLEKGKNQDLNPFFCRRCISITPLKEIEKFLDPGIKTIIKNCCGIKTKINNKYIADLLELGK